MDKETVARELAEEMRTNGALRHRLGMVEGSEMATSELAPEIWFSAESGESFRIRVERA